MERSNRKVTEIEGRNDTLTVYNDRIRIERSGFVALFSMFEQTGSKEIPIEEITGITTVKRSVRIEQRGHSPPRNTSKADLNTLQAGLTQNVDELAEQVRAAVWDQK